MFLDDLLYEKAPIETERVLFHKTKAFALAAILAMDKLDTRTTDLPRGTQVSKGISLTRSYQYAQIHGRKNDPILVLDAKYIPTRPVAYWSPDERIKYNRPDEAEELATRPITVSRYLLSINSQVSFDTWFDAIKGLRDDTSFVPTLLGNKLDMFKDAVDNEYQQWRPYWNSWKPRWSI